MYTNRLQHVVNAVRVSGRYSLLTILMSLPVSAISAQKRNPETYSKTEIDALLNVKPAVADALLTGREMWRPESGKVSPFGMMTGLVETIAV